MLENILYGADNPNSEVTTQQVSSNQPMEIQKSESFEDILKKQQKKQKKSSWRNMITNSNITASSDSDISATGAMGSISISIGLVAFLVLIIFYMFRVSEASNIILFLDKTVIIMSLGSGLLGVRKVSSVIGSKKVEGHTLDSMLTDQERIKQEMRREYNQEKITETLEKLLDNMKEMDRRGGSSDSKVVINQ